MCIHRSCSWSTFQFTFQTEKKVLGVGSGTVDTTCLYFVPVYRVAADLPLKQKSRLPVLKEERWIQKMYTFFLFLEYLLIQLPNR